jgi:hypothetical protein
MSNDKKNNNKLVSFFTGGIKRIVIKIIIILALIAALACGGYFGYKKLMAVKVERLRMMVSRELQYCAELVVTKTSYSEIVSIKKSTMMGIARSYSIVRYNAVIRVGISDVTKSGVYVSPDGKSVYVTLPPLDVLGNDITGFEVFDEGRNIFVPIQTQEIFDEIKKSQDETLSRILESGLMKESETYTKTLVTRILSAMGFENIVVSQ